MNKELKGTMPMNLQIFAENGAGDGAAQGANGGEAHAEENEQFQIDYEKIANIIAGKQSATEESVLKGYFKQQGLTKEQMEQAIAAYKQQQAASQPDIKEMQNQIADAQKQNATMQAEVLKAQVQSAATMTAVTLGIDAKTIPYVLKMADFSQVTGQDGKINEEALKNAVSKVLEDIPALKPQTVGKNGFTQVGTGGSPTQHPQQTTPNQPTVPTKRWNRWN